MKESASASSSIPAKKSCPVKVKVVLSAPSVSSLNGPMKLESGDLPAGWERRSVPRRNSLRSDMVIISPSGMVFDRRGRKLENYLKSLNQPFGNISVKLTRTSPSSRLHPLSADSKPESVNVSKNKKKLKSNSTQTVRERRRLISALKDYNLNHEDDIFDSVDSSPGPSKILLNSSQSSSSSGSSSPASCHSTSLASLLPKVTREATPLQYRGVLLKNKDESIESANSFGHISFINRKLKQPRVAKKNPFQSRNCGGLYISKKKNSCEDQLKTLLKGFGTSDPHDDEDLSDVESYFTDDES